MNDRLSDPPAGIVRGTFAPETLNPPVVALTELIVQDSMMLVFVIDKVSDSEPPGLVVNPVVVFPFMWHALSPDVKFIAVTVIDEAAAREITTITTTIMTTTTPRTIQSPVRDFLGGGDGAKTCGGGGGGGGNTGATDGLAAPTGAPHFAQNPLPATTGLPHLEQ
jgi:hypothetical protein